MDASSTPNDDDDDDYDVVSAGQKETAKLPVVVAEQNVETFDGNILPICL